MGFFSGKQENEDHKLKSRNSKEKITDDGKLVLRKEELDIAKDKVRVGEVEISKEIIEEHKAVDVPVTREEVVIERRVLNNEHSDAPIEAEEVMRIPVAEERIDVGKHTVITGEVSAHKREVQETRQVSETLKREEARVHTDGDPNIIAEDEHKNE